MENQAISQWRSWIAHISESERVKALKKTPDYLTRFYDRLPKEVRVYVSALFLFVKNESIKKSAPAVAALLYFVLPFDILPDFMPLLGFADDIAVLQATLRYLHREIQPYLGQAREMMKSRSDILH